MSNSNNTSDIPEGATYKWTPAVRRLYENQLSYYKKVDDVWWVYSEVTGWRVSMNDPEWFDTETSLGYFIELDKEPTP